MSSSRKYSVNLLAEGSILADLHYGLFSRNWWIQRTFQIDGKSQVLTIPYQLYMSVVCILNGQQFFISIVKNDKTPSTPGFICFSNGENSQIEASASAAISNLYKKFFGGKTEHSGLLVLGFDDIKIVEKLLSNITFY